MLNIELQVNLNIYQNWALGQILDFCLRKVSSKVSRTQSLSYIWFVWDKTSFMKWIIFFDGNLLMVLCRWEIILHREGYSLSINGFLIFLLKSYRWIFRLLRRLVRMLIDVAFYGHKNDIIDVVRNICTHQMLLCQCRYCILTWCHS